MNNGLLPVVVSPEFLERIFSAIENDPETKFEVNLEKQTFTMLSTGETESFEINPYKKHCLINGLDDIDYLVEMQDEIAAF